MANGDIQAAQVFHDGTKLSYINLLTKPPRLGPTLTFHVERGGEVEPLARAGRLRVGLKLQLVLEAEGTPANPLRSANL